MKAVILALAAIAVSAIAMAESPVRLRQMNAVAPLSAKKAPSNDLCMACLNFYDQSINILLNIILQEGVVGSCGKICGALANKTHSPTLGSLCNIFCDIAGVEEFIKIIETLDLDPFYFCELLSPKVCPINDNGDATITSFVSNPASGPQGTTFEFDMMYTSVNGTGTGEVSLEIKTVDGIPLGASDYNPAAKPGQYGGKWQVKAAPDPSCDPTQEECENWLPGTYQVDVYLCYGECGSKHPHSAIYSQASLNFTVTN
eukprot:m.220677 g.220677  ORF g.220677 m.220677 type:complete len:258 (+) comp10434_c0_seq1:1193-1966(+)